MMKRLLLGLCACYAIAAIMATDQLQQPAQDNDDDEQLQPRITNGFDADSETINYIVGLAFANDESAWWCGGSIIGNNWILTAAHCTNGANEVEIRYGAIERDEPLLAYIVNSSNFIQNRFWPYINGNDISIIRTPYVEFSDRINKVQLPSFSERHKTFANDLAMTCGWGEYYDRSGLADHLQCVDLRIIKNGKCGRTYGPLPANILCVATPEGKSTCSGDSGGPLVVKQSAVLVGVTSFVAVGGCQKGNPAGFTRVTGHLKWIRDNTGIAY